TDFQMFLDKRSRRSGQRKRSGIQLFAGGGTLPSDDHILDFAHAYYDADPVAEAFVQDAYVDGNPPMAGPCLIGHSLTELTPWPTHRRRWCDCSRSSRRIPRGSITIWSNAAPSSSGATARPSLAFSVSARCSPTPRTRSCSR